MDFSLLRYNVTTVSPNKKVIDVFPVLKEYKEFNNPKNDSLLRIAILATDENSPFLTKYRDDYERRMNAIFDFLKIKDAKLLERVMDLDDIDYSSIINRYLMLMDNIAYNIWYNMLHNFHMIGYVLRQPPDMSDLVKDMNNRAILQAQQVKIHPQLVALEAEIFPDAVVRKIARKEVAKIIQIPERYAQDKQVI
jgi:hypothetical protein